MIGFAFAGLLLGLILGVYCPFRVPPEYARLLAVAVMAGMWQCWRCTCFT